MFASNEMAAERDVITQLRAYLTQTELPDDGRLPPERELSEALGVSRTELRKALSALESEGQLWRHVGKGTFIGSRPLDTFADIAALARRTRFLINDADSRTDQTLIIGRANTISNSRLAQEERCRSRSW